MVALRHVEIPYYRRVGRQRRRRFWALAQVFDRTASPILPKYVVPAAKCIGADMLEFAAPEIGEVISGRKFFKSAAKSVGKQFLKKQVGEESRGVRERQRKGAPGVWEAGRGSKQKRIIPTKSTKTIQSVAKRHFSKHSSLIMSNNNFRYQSFVAVSGNLGGKVPIVDDVLSSQEQDIYPTTSLDENCIEVEFQTDRNYYVHLRQFFFGIEAHICQRTW